MWASGVKAEASGAAGFESKFSVTRITNNQMIANNTWVQVDFQSVVYDTLEEYDNVTNDRFDVADAGWYHLSVMLRINMASSPTAIEIKLSGSMGDVPIEILSDGIASVAYQSISFSGDLWMDAGAHIEVMMRQTTGGNREMLPGSTFSGHRFA